VYETYFRQFHIFKFLFSIAEFCKRNFHHVTSKSLQKNVGPNHDHVLCIALCLKKADFYILYCVVVVCNKHDYATVSGSRGRGNTLISVYKVKTDQIFLHLIVKLYFRKILLLATMPELLSNLSIEENI
jgi:hypothetical protein